MRGRYSSNRARVASTGIERMAAHAAFAVHHPEDRICTEAERIAAALYKPRPRKPPKVVSIRRFSWEQDK